MAIATKLTPTFPLMFGGYTFPGYTAVYTVILNLAVALVLTPVFNGVGGKSAAVDETAAADYYA
jgi:SSS family solute:Na+ symporter